MAKVNFTFKNDLDRAIGGAGASLCFQCGACVGDCPAAIHSERFNPRQIMLDAILGLSDTLLSKDSVVWECTNCTNCFEHCPQDVRPVEVIIALKNMNYEAGLAPEHVGSNVGSVQETGRTILVNDLIHKRRRELGLPDLGEAPTDELQKLMGNGAS